VYPGTFDPVTNGHLDIAARAARLFDQVIIAVFDRPDKRLLFNTEERIALLQESVHDLPNVSIDTYNTLTVEYARRVGAAAIVRGLRTLSDFEQEFQMAQVNRTLAPEVDYVTLMADREHTILSSSRVRELAALGGDVAWMVPPHVVVALRRAYNQEF
jgi:pantetheine-phosphate adenylyltransferase